MPEKEIKVEKPIVDLEKMFEPKSLETILGRLDTLEEEVEKQSTAKGRQILSVADPAREEDAVNKKYVDGNGARAYRGTTNQAINISTWTKVQLNVETFDIDGEFDIATNYRFTAKKAGYYVACGQIKITGAVDQSALRVALYKNGTSISETITETSNGGGTEPTTGITDIVYLDIGGYIELYAYHYYGGAEEIVKGSNNTFLAIYKLT